MSTDKFQVISPVDGSVYVERELADNSLVQSVIEQSHKAFKLWKQTSLAERKAICIKAITYFQNNADQIAEEITWQMGRPIQYSPFEIKNGMKERAQHMIHIAEKALADVKVEDLAGCTRFIRKEPVGAVLVLAPWNYPYLTAVNSIIPAIMAGNAVILKTSDQTPLCAERFAAAFKEAGMPDSVFQYLHISHRQVANVINDKRINYVAFTGSVEGGKAIQKAVSDRFLTAGLELGGKDPAYVRADADIQHAAENLVDGAFFNSGQSCCGIERIYVHEHVADDFIKAFVEITKSYVLGNPTHKETTIGPMVRKSAAMLAQQQLDEAIDMGAVAMINEGDFPKMEFPYFAPQVLTQVTHDMEIMKEESFAPIVGIMVVNNDDEAARLMNDSRYGLTASVWTTNVDEAIKIGDKINTGTWYMNRCDYLDPALAWTGVKDSGKGCTLSTLGYDQLTRPKSFYLKH